MSALFIIPGTTLVRAQRRCLSALQQTLPCSPHLRILQGLLSVQSSSFYKWLAHAHSLEMYWRRASKALGDSCMLGWRWGPLGMHYIPTRVMHSAILAWGCPTNHCPGSILESKGDSGWRHLLLPSRRWRVKCFHRWETLKHPFGPRGPIQGSAWLRNATWSESGSHKGLRITWI